MDNSQLILSTNSKDFYTLPRYMQIKCRPPDCYVIDMIIDREKISIIDLEHCRIRVDGVWLALYNPQTKMWSGR